MATSDTDTERMAWLSPLCIISHTLNVNFIALSDEAQLEFIRSCKLNAVRHIVTEQPAPSHDIATGIYTVEGQDWLTWQVARWGKPMYVPKELPAELCQIFEESGMKVIHEPTDLHPNTKEKQVFVKAERDDNTKSDRLIIRYLEPPALPELVELPKIRIANPCPYPPRVQILIHQTPVPIAAARAGQPDTLRDLPAFESAPMVWPDHAI